MVLRSAAAAALSLLLAAGCATRPGSDNADARRALHELLAASDEGQLELNPMTGLYRGDLRRADRFGNDLTPGYIAASRRAAEQDLAAVAAIPRAALPAADRVAYDAFRWMRDDARAFFSPPASEVWPALWLDHFGGSHIYFAVVSSGVSVAPYRSVKDYDDGLARIDGFIAWLDTAMLRMREGSARGVVQPRFAVERLIAQFENFAVQGVEESPYFAPLRALPDSISVTERRRLRDVYIEAIDGRLRPAFRRMLAFLRDEYLAAARTAPGAVGLGAVAGGSEYYRWLVRSSTTLPLTPQEVHNLGLTEVARLTREMDKVKVEAGFAGTLPQFFDCVRVDPRFRPASAEALVDGYRAIGRRVATALPRLFDVQPATPLEIRPTPDFQAPTDAGARYVMGSLDTGKPGVFYVNTHDLPSRSLFDMETLYLHEALPGHHLQIMLAAESADLPKTQRFGGNTAYVEGWALYAETLGPELGLFTDVYQRFGHLDAQMLRALRLVVDTGLHAYGWSREQAIEYMLAHSAMGRTDAVAEVERYIVSPGQALAYKVGEQWIRRLRERAEAALGARFDVRAFHREVLMTGSLPLAVLEAKIDDWITAQRR